MISARLGYGAAGLLVGGVVTGLYLAHTSWGRPGLETVGWAVVLLVCVTYAIKSERYAALRHGDERRAAQLSRTIAMAWVVPALVFGLALLMAAGAPDSTVRAVLERLAVDWLNLLRNLCHALGVC